MKTSAAAVAASLTLVAFPLVLPPPFAVTRGQAQIPPAPSPTDVVYRASGTLNEPFSVEVVDVRRADGNTLVVRLNLRNDGSGPLNVGYDFAAGTNPGDARKISGLYLVDPNGRARLGVLRDAAGAALCTTVDPDLTPGERRLLTARFVAPAVTSNAVEVHFPRTAEPIVGVPIGLSAAGEPIPTNEPVTAQPSATVRRPPRPDAEAQPSPAIETPGTNYRPNVYTNELPGTEPAAGNVKKTAGHVQASNSDVPFTVEILSLRRVNGGNGGGGLELRVALTNNSSGPFDVGDYFTAGRDDAANARRISGVYVVDPKTQARATVARDAAGKALCSEVRPLDPGERRELSARLAPAPAAGTRSVYLYFPQASPIANVPVE